MIAKERPILFNAEMVRAILDGRKTQTRRIVTRNNSTVLGSRWGRSAPWEGIRFAEGVARPRNPLTGTTDPHIAVPFCHPEDEPTDSEDCGIYRVRSAWEPGDRLWVRENFAIVPATAYRMSEGVQQTIDPNEPHDAAIYAAGWDRSIPRWRPSIHMPRWASRITLEITEVRGERLQDISHEDAFAEGAPQYSSALKLSRNRPFMPEHKGCYREGFSELWESVYGPGAWDTNPWVWAITFRRVGSSSPFPTTEGRRANPESHTEEVS